jgi:hypothetical protein
MEGLRRDYGGSVEWRTRNTAWVNDPVAANKWLLKNPGWN